MKPGTLPFSRPSLGEEEIREVVETLESGWITSGPRVARFEEAFAEYVGAEHAVALSSCTAALHLALLAHGLGENEERDEIVTTAMTWPATVNMIERVGARPVFADVEPATLQLDPEQVERVITPRTRAILPVHFAGQACRMRALRELARSRDLIVIEDAAHAVGTEVDGRRIGSDGTACFSFHPIKNITTGEGGMLTTASSEIAERARLLRFHGVSRDAWQRYAGEKMARYESVLPGFKYNLTDLQAAIGIHQLAKLDRFIERRARLADAYAKGLEQVPELRPLGFDSETTRHAWHLYVVTLDLERLRCDRDRFAQRLQERGIGTGLHFTAVHLHRYYRERYGFRIGDLPNAEWASERVLSLPLFPDMASSDVERVIEVVSEIVDEERQ